jgi:hypothetical protein
MSHQGAQQESGAEGDGHSEGSETGSEEGQAAAASEDVEVVEELDEEELMQQLGLQLEQQLQEVERQGLPADVLARYEGCAAGLHLHPVMGVLIESGLESIVWGIYIRALWQRWSGALCIRLCGYSTLPVPG